MNGSKLEGVLAGIFTDGPFPCAECGCLMDLPGVCDRCYEQKQQKQARQQCAAALASLPRTMSWANFDVPALRSRVERSTDGKDPIAWCRRVTEVLVTGAARNVVLQGPTGVGKTALACAMMRLVTESHPQVGEGARFMSCVDMSMCRREARWGEGRPKSLELARCCKLLVFDDLSQETHGTDVAIEVIHARYDAQLPTIFTTWATAAALAERYGGGTQRRVFDQAAVFDWDPRRSERAR